MCCHESSPSKGKNNNNSSKNNNKNTQHTAYLAYTQKFYLIECLCVWMCGCMGIHRQRQPFSLTLSFTLSAIPNSHCHSHAIANTHTYTSHFFWVFLLFVLFPVWFQRSLFRLSDLSLSYSLSLSLVHPFSFSVPWPLCVPLARTTRLVLAAVNSYCGFMLVFQPSSFCFQNRKVPGELGG